MSSRKKNLKIIYLLHILSFVHELTICTSDPVHRLDLFLKDGDHQKDQDLF